MSKLDWKIFEPKFGEWARYFEPLFEKTDVMDGIYAHLKRRKAEGAKILPEPKDTFRCFTATKPNNLKAVFVLYDPYPSVKSGVTVATGVAMDCSNTKILQPSLEKFYEAIEKSECAGLDLQMLKPDSLDYLCEQGIMFFNTALTVEQDKTGSHTQIWEPFMKYFYEEVMSQFSGMIYILCGKDSQKMRRWIPLMSHIINLEHPSYAGRQYREWKYDDVFKKINYILKNNNGPEAVIDWVLEEAPF